MKSGVGIIGCGRVGKKRSALLPQDLAISYYDINSTLSQELANERSRISSAKTLACKTLHELLTDSTIQSVIIATPHSELTSIALQALSAGKHILIEKPGALSIKAWNSMKTLADQNQLLIRIGYNLRFHPSLMRAKEIILNGELGPLFMIRARYGHGARLGYENEWRMKDRSLGGGELIDQGVHLIDLAHWFMGDFETIEGHLANLYWQSPAEDNAFISLRNKNGQTAWLHASCSEWKNTFSLEIYGTQGKLHAEGLGGSYGSEKLTHFKMGAKMGPPDALVYEFKDQVDPWSIEMNAFFEDIRLKRTPCPGYEEGLKVLRVVESLHSKGNNHPT